MKKIQNVFKTILKYILKHPIITTTIICLILCFIDGRANKQWNFAGYAFLELFIIALLSPYIRKLKRDNHYNKYNNKTTVYPNQQQEINTTSEYINSYEPKYLMTQNEKEQFKKIKDWADKNGLIVFTKVRLLDLITPRRNIDNFKGALWKIQAKHVDFIICDNKIIVKCIIEIDDNSHNKTERIERDNFVTDVLKACGYKVLRTYNITEEQLDRICDIKRDPAGAPAGEDQ